MSGSTRSNAKYALEDPPGDVDDPPALENNVEDERGQDHVSALPPAQELAEMRAQLASLTDLVTKLVTSSSRPSISPTRSRNSPSLPSEILDNDLSWGPCFQAQPPQRSRWAM